MNDLEKQKEEYLEYQKQKKQFQESKKTGGQSANRQRSRSVRESYEQSRQSAKAEEIARSSVESRKRRARAKEMNPFERILEGAMDESKKLFALGGRDVLNNLNFMQSALTGAITGDDRRLKKAAESRVNLQKDVAKNREEMKEFNEEAWATGGLGRMAPYLATSYAAGPRLAAGASALGKGASSLGRKAMGKTGRNKKFPMKDPFFEGARSRIVGDTGLGAAEGALHPDMTAEEGAIASVIGTGTGLLLNPKMARRPVTWGESEKALLKRVEKNTGYRASPAVRTGSNILNMREQGFRSSGKYADDMAEFDKANQKAINEEAYNMMGIPESVRSKGYLSSDDLNLHLKTIGKEYDDLVEGTTGLFNKKSLDEMRDIVQKLSRDGTESGKAAYNAARNQLNAFKKIKTSTKDSKTGRFQVATFDGKEYQKLKSNLNADINDINQSNAVAISNALRPMRKKLEEAMELGVKRDKGDASLAKWKDVDERYAMTKLVMNEGMDTSTRDIDLRSLGNYFKNNDVERVLKGKGGRVSRLHDLANIYKLERKLKGNANNTAGMQGENISSTFRKSILGNPGQDLPSGTKKLMLRAYLKGTTPKSLGLLGTGKADDFYNFPAITRAADMSSQLHNKAIDQGQEWYGDLMSIYDRNFGDRSDK